ncbi:hypothetical protein SAMN04488569_104412 [Marinilactibacillus piezotolerans]|uniref:Uncharacterized protein n=1 Tax=Marinilactibacillus piezotolerans TaxID=258723 RepID=A0A1I4A893_9LACT|nr:hypothetical protein SAMN04488569_104412 [Marinilactibacillus piezotolerans]
MNFLYEGQTIINIPKQNLYDSSKILLLLIP